MGRAGTEVGVRGRIRAYSKQIHGPVSGCSNFHSDDK